MMEPINGWVGYLCRFGMLGCTAYLTGLFAYGAFTSGMTFFGGVLAAVTLWIVASLIDNLIKNFGGAAK